MNETGRQKTLQVLIELASGWDQTSCWDSNRAEDLLRSQSTPAELEALGAGKELIARLWPERYER